MRTARISRPDALYDAPIASRNFDEANRAILNPIDCDGALDVNIAKSTDNLKFAQLKGYGIFGNIQIRAQI